MNSHRTPCTDSALIGQRFVSCLPELFWGFVLKFVRICTHVVSFPQSIAQFFVRQLVLNVLNDCALKIKIKSCDVGADVSVALPC